MTDIIKVAAYWKIFGRTGKEIDAIEGALSNIVGVTVTRTDFPIDADTYDAVYCVKSDAVEATRFVDGCHFMSDVDAHPI